VIAEGLSKNEFAFVRRFRTPFGGIRGLDPDLHLNASHDKKLVSSFELRVAG
jgi:hypothetical protein